MKYFIILIILFSSCTQYTAVTSLKPEYTLTLNNSIIGVDLYELDNQVFVKNISEYLIIEFNYNINDNIIIIYDVLVPNKEMFLSNWDINNCDVDIIINSVRFY